MTARRASYGPIPMQYAAERTRLVVLAVGVVMLLTGVLLIVGIAVIL